MEKTCINSTKRIVAQVAKITEAVIEMATAAKEQANGLNEVNAGINLMDKSVQKNSVMAQESASATHLLAQQTTELVDLTARFQLEKTPKLRNGRAEVMRRSAA